VNTTERILAECAEGEPWPVARVCVGRKYTAVELADGSVGVALTQLPEHMGCCNEQALSSGDRMNADALLQAAADRVAELRTTTELLPLLSSSNSVLAAVALACVNAVANREDVEVLGGDILDHLVLRPSDTVGMVGLFRPLLAGLRSAVETLHIFERHGGDGLLPADQAVRMLPSCDVALLTAATISNGTVDRLLEAASSCRDVALLGASTPFLASAFKDSPVSWLSGSVVVGREQTLRVVAEGGGRREFNPYLKKGNLYCG
jgi:uncharacterized protein (DUF4213/DUF364 family)